VIKIYQDCYKNLQIVLQDRNGQVITNPNTSLLTTMHISILFAISELTRESREADYPLIFDAPTSSFDEGKDKTFYECLSNEVNKQCIVVTKSYLYKNSAGEFVTDRGALSRLDCQKYRIRKLSGFDKLDLTTIDTMVEEITED
jgi:wobble nucleotide-excising tRNase